MQRINYGTFKQGTTAPYQERDTPGSFLNTSPQRQTPSLPYQGAQSYRDNLPSNEKMKPEDLLFTVSTLFPGEHIEKILTELNKEGNYFTHENLSNKKELSKVLLAIKQQKKSFNKLAESIISCYFNLLFHKEKIYICKQQLVNIYEILFDNFRLYHLNLSTGHGKTYIFLVSAILLVTLNNVKHSTKRPLLIIPRHAGHEENIWKRKIDLIYTEALPFNISIISIKNKIIITGPTTCARDERPLIMIVTPSILTQPTRDKLQASPLLPGISDYQNYACNLLGPPILKQERIDFDNITEAWEQNIRQNWTIIENEIKKTPGSENFFSQLCTISRYLNDIIVNLNTFNKAPVQNFSIYNGPTQYINYYEIFVGKHDHILKYYYYQKIISLTSRSLLDKLSNLKQQIKNKWPEKALLINSLHYLFVQIFNTIFITKYKESLHYSNEKCITPCDFLPYLFIDEHNKNILYPAIAYMGGKTCIASAGNTYNMENETDFAFATQIIKCGLTKTSTYVQDGQIPLADINIKITNQSPLGHLLNEIFDNNGNFDYPNLVSDIGFNFSVDDLVNIFNPTPSLSKVLDDNQRHYDKLYIKIEINGNEYLLETTRQINTFYIYPKLENSKANSKKKSRLGIIKVDNTFTANPSKIHRQKSYCGPFPSEGVYCEGEKTILIRHPTQGPTPDTYTMPIPEIPGGEAHLTLKVLGRCPTDPQLAVDISNQIAKTDYTEHSTNSPTEQHHTKNTKKFKQVHNSHEKVLGDLLYGLETNNEEIRRRANCIAEESQKKNLYRILEERENTYHADNTPKSLEQFIRIMTENLDQFDNFLNLLFPLGTKMYKDEEEILSIDTHPLTYHTNNSETFAIDQYCNIVIKVNENDGIPKLLTLRFHFQLSNPYGQYNWRKNLIGFKYYEMLTEGNAITKIKRPQARRNVNMFIKHQSWKFILSQLILTKNIPVEFFDVQKYLSKNDSAPSFTDQNASNTLIPHSYNSLRDLQIWMILHLMKTNNTADSNFIQLVKVIINKNLITRIESYLTSNRKARRCMTQTTEQREISGRVRHKQNIIIKAGGESKKTALINLHDRSGLAAMKGLDMLQEIKIVLSGANDVPKENINQTIGRIFRAGKPRSILLCLPCKTRAFIEAYEANLLYNLVNLTQNLYERKQHLEKKAGIGFFNDKFPKFHELNKKPSLGSFTLDLHQLSDTLKTWAKPGPITDVPANPGKIKNRKLLIFHINNYLLDDIRSFAKSYNEKIF